MMKTLTHEEQVVLVLCDIYGFSDKASCRMIGKKLGAFKHLLHKSRHLMKLISHDTCAVVGKTGTFSQCLCCNRFGSPDARNAVVGSKFEEFSVACSE